MRARRLGEERDGCGGNPPPTSVTLLPRVALHAQAQGEAAGRRQDRKAGVGGGEVEYEGHGGTNGVGGGDAGQLVGEEKGRRSTAGSRRGGEERTAQQPAPEKKVGGRERSSEAAAERRRQRGGSGKARGAGSRARSMRVWRLGFHRGLFISCGEINIRLRCAVRDDRTAENPIALRRAPTRARMLSLDDAISSFFLCCC